MIKKIRNSFQLSYSNIYQILFKIRQIKFILNINKFGEKKKENSNDFSKYEKRFWEHKKNIDRKVSHNF